MGNRSRQATGHAPTELEILRQIRQRAASIPSTRVRLGIGDDCALLAPRPGEELAVTTDLSIAGRHFRLDWHPPESIGHRTLARGLSDLAAMGASPTAAFLSLALPPELTRRRAAAKSWLDRFLDGFFALARHHGVPLAGGDLAQSPIAVADIVLTGTLPRSHAGKRTSALLRSGAAAGDRVCVTGSLGGAAAELAALAANPRRFRRFTTAAEGHPHLYPQPRLAQGRLLRKLASAALDISDGLSTELAHLASASGVAIEIDAAQIPLAPAASLNQALHGGEDYELLFTVPADVRLPRSLVGVPVTVIGRVLPPARNKRSSPPAVTLLENGQRHTLTPRGWEHFRAD